MKSYILNLFRCITGSKTQERNIWDGGFFLFIVQGIVDYYPEKVESKEEEDPAIPSMNSFLRELRDEPESLTQTLIRSEALYVELARYMYLEKKNRDHPLGKGEIEVFLISDTCELVRRLRIHFTKEMANLPKEKKFADIPD
ncbi:MAG: hypothetical protein V4686_00380 [Patescibacteria group bacterium]